MTKLRLKKNQTELPLSDLVDQLRICFDSLFRNLHCLYPESSCTCNLVIHQSKKWRYDNYAARASK
jgi:hypothetical protein